MWLPPDYKVGRACVQVLRALHTGSQEQIVQQLKATGLYTGTRPGCTALPPTVAR